MQSMSFTSPASVRTASIQMPTTTRCITGGGKRLVPFQGNNAQSRRSPQLLSLVNRRMAMAVGTTATPEAASTSSANHSRHTAKRIATLKTKLLAAVASLDRGLAANGREAMEVDDLVRQLETLAGPVVLEAVPGEVTVVGDATVVQKRPSALTLLPGIWRLVYTSGFNTGSLGGTRPGPPAALVPSVLGQIYQRIDARKGRLDNIVEFVFLTNPLTSLPKFLFGSNTSAGGDYPETPGIRLTLKHDYELQGSNTVKIVYEDTSAELVGSSAFAQLPKFDVPQLPDFLKPPRNFRSATFDVVFLDKSMRITRGDRQELRIYLRDEEAGATLGPNVPLGAFSDESIDI